MPRSPNADYEEVPVKKTEPKGPIDSVIARLKGSQSGKFTKLARRFNRAKRLSDLLKKEEKALKDETKKALEEYFDTADEAYTRVVETASLVFKLSKASEKQVEEFDQAGYIDELENLLESVYGVEKSALEAIRKKKTSTTTKVTPTRVLAPKEKKPAKESLRENSFASKAERYFNAWDARFDQLENNIKSNLKEAKGGAMNIPENFREVRDTLKRAGLQPEFTNKIKGGRSILLTRGWDDDEPGQELLDIKAKAEQAVAKFDNVQVKLTKSRNHYDGVQYNVAVRVLN